MAAPLVPATAKIRATVSDDLRTIRGTIAVDDYPGLQWLDLLSQLPLPNSDRVEQRTFTHVKEKGFMRLESPKPSGRNPTFHVVFPRRMGASGLVPDRGLFVNGLWHPHPVLDGRSALIMWDVELKLPENTVGVLNGAVAEGILRWKGTADRLSLAVVRNARIQHHDLGPMSRMTLVDSGPKRPLRDARLKTVANTGIDPEAARSFAVVETPSRRRLIRQGPHTLYLSDRVFRLYGQQWKNHIPAVRRGLHAVSLDVWDPWSRELIAGLTPATQYKHRSLWSTLRWTAFLPQVDSLIYDGRSPFVSDIFEEVWPSDSLRDDALEMVDNPMPPRVAAKKLERLYGSDTMQTWATAVIAGAHPEDAISIAELSPTALRDWYAYPADQDVSVAVTREPNSWRIDIKRNAPNGVTSEPIPFSINGESRVWTATKTTDTLSFTDTKKPRHVKVDPQKEVFQNDHSNDTWPKPQTFTASGSLSEINLEQLRPNAAVYLVSRRPFSTRWVHGLVANTSVIERMGLSYRLGYSFGRLLDRRNRTWRAWLSPGMAWLDPDFDARYAGGIAADWAVGIRKDTRDAWPISRHGHAYSWYGGSGGIVGGASSWLFTGAQASIVAPIGGLLVTANRLKLDTTTSQLPHRRLGLGGIQAVQGLSSSFQRGQRRVAGTSEMRFMPIRHASIPVWLAWVTHIQLSAAVDGAWLDDSAALGWNAGIAAAADVFGRQSAMAGLWLASPIWTHNTETLDKPPPQLYLRASQSF